MAITDKPCSVTRAQPLTSARRSSGQPSARAISASSPTAEQPLAWNVESFAHLAPICTIDESEIPEHLPYVGGVALVSMQWVALVSMQWVALVSIQWVALVSMQWVALVSM